VSAQGVELSFGGARHRSEILLARDERVEFGKRRGELAAEGTQPERARLLPRHEPAQPALEGGDRHRRHPAGDDVGRQQLAGDRGEEDRPWAKSVERTRGEGNRRARLKEGQAPPARGLPDGVPDAGIRAMHETRPQRSQLVDGGGYIGLRAGRRDRGDLPAGCGRGAGGMQNRTAGDGRPIGQSVDGEAADDEQIGRGYHRAMMRLFFYELHEGATDLLTDALLVSEEEHTPEAFASMVLAARAAVVDTFEEDTLVEAIARELERRGAFVYIADEKLRGSMSVGLDPADTFLVDPSEEYRSLIAEVDLSS